MPVFAALLGVALSLWRGPDLELILDRVPYTSSFPISLPAAVALSEVRAWGLPFSGVLDRGITGKIAVCLGEDVVESFPERISLVQPSLPGGPCHNCSWEGSSPSRVCWSNVSRGSLVVTSGPPGNGLYLNKAGAARCPRNRVVHVFPLRLGLRTTKRLASVAESLQDSFLHYATYRIIVVNCGHFLHVKQ